MGPFLLQKKSILKLIKKNLEGLTDADLEGLERVYSTEAIYELFH
jgi:hypothetical protein